jgi:hypothetical protein
MRSKGGHTRDRPDLAQLVERSAVVRYNGNRLVGGSTPPVRIPSPFLPLFFTFPAAASNRLPCLLVPASSWDSCFFVIWFNLARTEMQKDLVCGAGKKEERES